MKEVGGDEIYTDEEWAEDENAYRKEAFTRHIGLGVDLQCFWNIGLEPLLTRFLSVAQFSLDAWSALGQLDYGGDARDEGGVAFKQRG